MLKNIFEEQFICFYLQQALQSLLEHFLLNTMNNFKFSFRCNTVLFCMNVLKEHIQNANIPASMTTGL